MKTRTLGSLLAVVAVALIAVSGCSGPKGPPTVKVTGKIHNNGKPLPMDPARYKACAAKVELQFGNDGPNNEFSETAFADPEGNFQVQLPVGKYRIGVGHYPDGTANLLGSKFDVEKSPIKREVTATTTEINIDLANPGKP